LFEAAAAKSDATARRSSAMANWIWLASIAIFFAATILKSGPLSHTLPTTVWNAVQFGPILLATFVVFLARLKPNSKLPTPQSRVVWALAVFALAATLSLITSSEIATTAAQLVILFIMFLFLAATFKFRWLSARDINSDLLWIYALIGANQAVGLFGAILGAKWAVGDFYRLTGTTSNANFAGILSAVGLSIGVHLFIHSNRRIRLLIAILGAFELATLVWSGSRGAMLAILVGLVALLIVKRRWRVLIVSTIAMLIAVVALFALLPNLLARVSLGDLDSGRFELYATVIGHWLEHPVLGIGYRTTQALQGTQGFEAHNIYLSVLGETGIIGFIAFIGLLLSVFFAGRSNSLVIGAVTVVVNEFSESSIFGWGSPTALFAWIALLGFAALGRFTPAQTPPARASVSKDQVEG
jgi:O-antigen ligase